METEGVAASTGDGSTPSNQPQQMTAGAITLTAALVEEACIRHSGYRTPELNRTLYLHHMNLSRLCNLAPYLSCTVLYLSHNLLDDLTPLAPLTQLHSLYLTHNALTRCDQLPSLPGLRQLDISHNAVHTLVGLSRSAPLLETLLAAHNQITQMAEVAALTQLSTLDVSGNALSESSEVLAALTRRAATLRTCVLSGNPVVRQITCYRYRLIAALTELRFLDELPVSVEERARAAAHALAGAPAVAQVRARMRQTQSQQRRDAFDSFTRLRESWAEEGRQAAAGGGAVAPTTYALLNAADPCAVRGGAEEDDIYVGDASCK